MTDVRYTTVSLSDGTQVQVVEGGTLHHLYRSLAATGAGTVGATGSTVDTRQAYHVIWFMTPFGPQAVASPTTIAEFRRRDYAEISEQQARDYFAGVARPQPVSFVTEQELADALAGLDGGTGPIPEDRLPARLSEAALRGAFVPPVASSATVYVHSSGGDDASGRSWNEAKQTIPAAIAALGAAGGTVELGAGVHDVSSSGRLESCTYAAGASLVACAGITAGDVGSYVISAHLRSPALITSVNPGVNFTYTDQSGLAFTPESSGTVTSIITDPAIVVPPGVHLRGRGPQWTADRTAQDGVLNDANTWIEDSGTGVTILCGHPQDGGAANSGQRAVGVKLDDFAVKGNDDTLFGVAQINNWAVVGTRIDSVGHGMGGLLVAANANTTRFADCRFGGNGTADADVVTAGVIVLENIPKIPFGPVKFDNCFFTDNYGWNVAGTTDFAAVRGARSVRVSQGQFNRVYTTPVASSGTHVAIHGDEFRSLLDDCIFESADFLHVDVYGAPVTAVACKFLATGGRNGTLPFMVRLNANALFEAIGCGFIQATSHHVQVGAGATFNWRSCYSTGGSFTLAADAAGNALALQNAAGLPAGSTSNPVEPLNGLAGQGRGNETCPRLMVNSSAVPLTNRALNLTYFTATRSVSVDRVALEVGGTASGGSAAFIGVGLYFLTSDGSLTLIAQTTGANANAFNSANATATLTFGTPAFVTQGRRYAIGVLVDSSNGLPTFRGIQASSLSLSGTPVIAAAVTGQTSLPASIPSASIGSGGAVVYARLP